MTNLRYSPNNLKVEDVFYSVFDWFDEEENSVHIELHEWHVRSIRARRGTKTQFGIPNAYTDKRLRVNLIRKDATTWVKLSKKNGDYGWSSSISADCRNQFVLGEELPVGIFTTQLQALKYAVKKTEKTIERIAIYMDEETSSLGKAEFQEEMEIERRILKALKNRIVRMRNRNKRAKVAVS